jgi:hypothetical protein
MNAGNVIRLNTPKTMMKDRIAQERSDLRFYTEVSSLWPCQACLNKANLLTHDPLY